VNAEEAAVLLQHEAERLAAIRDTSLGDRSRDYLMLTAAIRRARLVEALEFAVGKLSE
jgi:hypothetical protein